jgi:NADH:ubiquinone oxidoreductase subunit 3 (subunit A)
MSYRFSLYNPDTEKVSAYECGFDPYDDARNVFDVRFYLVAILFVIFDLETVYFFPWCLSLSFLNDDAFWGMIDFIIELGVGLIDAWEVGALVVGIMRNYEIFEKDVLNRKKYLILVKRLISSPFF